MSIIYPENRKEVSDRMGTDAQNELPNLTPLLRNSVIRSLIIAFAGRIFDLYEQQQLAQLELFPDTATELDFQRRWGLLKGVDINAASPSIGFITATGTPGVIIPEGTLYSVASDQDYETLNQDYEIQSVNLRVESLTRSGSVATAEFTVDHKFASGIPVTFSGANEAEYNVTDAIVTAVDERKVTYEITGTPATPATGVINGSSDIASIEVQSVGTGIIQNQDSGAELTIKNPIASLDDTAFVQFTNLIGGEDEQTSDEYRAEYLGVWRNPISNFNDSDIERTLMFINGITKVWTFDAMPQAGQCEIYFIRGNDTPIFPSVAEVNQAKDALLKIKTAPMRDEDVIVSSPTAVTVPFNFTALIPNSQEMHSAIKESLKQLFLDDTNVSVPMTSKQYNSAIIRTRNPLTGEFVTDFTLSTPIGDIPISHGELPDLGDVTFSI